MRQDSNWSASPAQPVSGAARFFINRGCDAVVCSTITGHRPHQQVNAFGRRVPGDISVTGFDSASSRVTRPAVTTVALPTYEMAFLASR